MNTTPLSPPHRGNTDLNRVPRRKWSSSVLCTFVMLAIPSISQAQTASAVTGQLADQGGLPLSEVRVTIVELGRRTATDSAGRYRIGSLPAGTYTVSFSRLGLAPETRRIAFTTADHTLNVRMRPTGIDLAPVQVTASTTATRVQDSPQPTSVLEGAELRTSQGTALGDVLEQIPGVRTLSMTTGIGKPVIRGMTHYRVVTLDNGQRTETQAWGHDHSPNVETATAERIEVIKGPSSVLYGSDALGGVINVIAPALPDAIDVAPFARGNVIASYNHNIRGTDGTVSVEAAAAGAGARLAITSRSSGDMRTPAGTLGNTNNSAIAPEVALGYRGSRGTIAARYTARHERIEIFDNPVTSPNYTGFQKIASHRASVDFTTPLPGMLLQINGGYEQNFRREFAAASATIPDLGLFVRNWTGFAHGHHSLFSVLSGTVGVSGMTSHFENLGSKTLIPNSDTRSIAVYVFEQADLGRWKLMAGSRFDARSLDTKGNASIGVGADRRNFTAITGSLGALYKVREPFAVVANVARGFRAPSAPDLFANGFHEGTRAFERGDPNLEVETSVNTDIGFRVSAHDLTGEATAFVNRVNDYIYLRPFGTGGGAFDSLQVVQGNARLTGFEGRLAYRPLDFVTLQLSGDYVRGQNTTANVPLTFIPPLRVISGIRLATKALGRSFVNPYFTSSIEVNARQTRVDPRDVAPPGYTLSSFGAGIGRLMPRGVLNVDVSVRNAFNTQYRSFMSRYKEYALAPGRTLVLRLSTPL
ncbi:MAG TPA: TonB-dependent receptor [Gemmatimonadaceae bacterium]|nr:TonB-dependent receptor [Gemmatimonadaceae bacterium]